MKVNKQSGQVLLITVMLLATALTVVLSLSFKSTTETQITKLEEESQKALAAAEAGIEKGLKSDFTNKDFTGLGLNFSGINATQSTVSFDNSPQPYFITPLLQKDEQYTFYFGYDPADKSFDGWDGRLTFFFGTTNATCAGNPGNVPILELTLITSTNTLTKYLIDTCNQMGTPNILSVYNGSGIHAPGDTTTTFYYQSTSIFGPFVNVKVLIARVLNSGTKIGFYATSGTPNLPLQGTMVTSEAKSNTGVTKKVTLFQSYPQIPADFFVTSF